MDNSPSETASLRERMRLAPGLVLRHSARLVRAIADTAYGAVYEPISPKPIALFRIAFSFVLFAEFFHCVHRRELFFNLHPLTETVPAAVITDLWIWFFALVCTLVGFLTPIAAFISYRYTVQYFGLDGTFCYHADMLYVPSALLVAVLPVYRAYSVDRWITKRLLKIDLADFPIPRLFNNLVVLWVI